MDKVNDGVACHRCKGRGVVDDNVDADDCGGSIGTIEPCPVCVDTPAAAAWRAMGDENYLFGSGPFEDAHPDDQDAARRIAAAVIAAIPQQRPSAHPSRGVVDEAMVERGMEASIRWALSDEGIEPDRFANWRELVSPDELVSFRANTIAILEAAHTTSARSWSGEIPPLPESSWDGDGRYDWLGNPFEYTAHDMRDYARAALQAAQPAVPSVPEWTAVLDALDAVNEAANDARHRGEYGKANKLVNARVTLYRAALANEEAATPAHDQPEGEG